MHSLWQICNVVHMLATSLLMSFIVVITQHTEKAKLALTVSTQEGS